MSVKKIKTPTTKENMYSEVDNVFGIGLSALKQAYDEAVALITLSFENSKESVETSHKRALEELHYSNEQEIKKLADDHSRKLEEYRHQANVSLRNAEEDYNKKVAEFNKKLTLLQEEIGDMSSAKAKIGQLEGNLTETTKLLEKNALEEQAQKFEREKTDTAYQTRISQLEAENGKLQGMLKAAQTDVAKLTDIIATSGKEALAAVERVSTGKDSGAKLEELKNYLLAFSSKK